MSNFKSPNPNIAPLSEKEAAMIDQMSDAISTMPREHMSELQKWFLRLTEHTYRLQIKFQNLAIHASNQEKKADDLLKLIGKIKGALDISQSTIHNDKGDAVQKAPSDRYILDIIEMHINEMIIDNRKEK